MIFDRSGTLNNNITTFKEFCELVFKLYKKDPISLEEIQENFETPYMKFWNKYIPELSKEDQDNLFIEYMPQLSPNQLYPWVYETLTKLYQNGIKLFVISSDHYETLLPEINKGGINDLFLKVYWKIHDKRETLKELMMEFNIPADSAIIVGDTNWDIEAWKYVSMKTIWITWGFQSKTMLEKSEPDIIIKKIEDIFNII